MAGFFDPTDPTAGGLMNGFAAPQGMPGVMGMLANPQTAGLLGMAGGLMQAAGASRLPVTNGAAMGAGFQGMQQGIGNAMQNQRALLTMQAMQGLMGNPQQSAPAQSSGPVGAPVSGAANTGPMSGPSAGLGAYAGAGSAPVNPNEVAPQGGPSIFGKTPQQLWQQGMMMNLAGIPGGADMMKMAAQYDPQLAYAMPTDQMKNVAAAYGQGTPQAQGAMQGILSKDMMTAIRPGGGIYNGMTNQMTMTPGANGVIQVQDPGSPTGWRTMVNPGASDVIQQQAAAEAGGKAQFKTQQVWDPTANGGQGGFVNQTVANVANAVNGNGVPLGIQNNNFGNIKGANGQFAKYDTPQDGVNAADGLLSTYGSKYGINTLTGIANRWSPAGDGNNNPAAKAAAMSAASGVPVNQPINLQDPAVRARILPALFDTETPGWRNAMGGRAPSAQGGPMAAQPPLGTTNAANTAQNAPAAQMEKAQGALSDADDNYQQSREVLQQMLGMARNQGMGDLLPRMLPQDIATKVSSDAATYQKLQANFIAMQGKALGNAGTDASRETLEESVPGFDKPQQAKITGLTDQLNQLDWRHLKRQTLSPLFQSGDPKQYTQTSSAFDNTIQPSMMPQLNQYLSMPPGVARTAALQQAITDPKMKAALDLMVQTGQLK